MIIPNPRVPLGYGSIPISRPTAQGAGPISQMHGRYFGSMKKGGKIKKTGLYKLHKGERVMATKLSSLVKA